jgi:hypothetical protein
MRLNRTDGESINRFRKAERSDFDETLFKLLKQDRNDYVPLSGPLLIITLVLLSFKLRECSFFYRNPVWKFTIT